MVGAIVGWVGTMVGATEGETVVGMAVGRIVGEEEGGVVGAEVVTAVGLMERSAYVHVKALDMPK